MNNHIVLSKMNDVFHKSAVPRKRLCEHMHIFIHLLKKTVPVSAIRVFSQIVGHRLFCKKGKEVSRRYHSKRANTMKKYIQT